MLLHAGIINAGSHYARKKFYVIQPVTRVDSDLSSYDMIEWPEEQKCMRLTIGCGERCRQCCSSPGEVTVNAMIKEEPLISMVILMWRL